MAQNEKPSSANENKPAGISDADRQKRLAELVLRRSKLSDEEAALLGEVFPAIVETHHDLVWNRLRRRGLESHDVEDLLQEVFFALHTFILERGFPDSIPERLYTIADGKVVTLLRSRKRAPVSVALPSSTSEKPRSSRDLDRAMDVRALAWHIFPQLSPEHQDVIETVVMNGLTHSEAAEVLGLPEGTVKSRLMAAKRVLVRLVEPLLPASQRGF